jgi:hypothetical protein
MPVSLKLLPGSTVRWHGQRYLIVDYASLDAIIARQSGKRRLERIPVAQARTYSRRIVAFSDLAGGAPTRVPAIDPS